MSCYNLNNHIKLSNTWDNKGNMHPTKWNPYPDMPGFSCKVPNQVSENYSSVDYNPYNYKKQETEWSPQKYSESYCTNCDGTSYKDLDKIWKGPKDSRYSIKNEQNYGVF